MDKPVHATEAAKATTATRYGRDGRTRPWARHTATTAMAASANTTGAVSRRMYPPDRKLNAAAAPSRARMQSAANERAPPCRRALAAGDRADGLPEVVPPERGKLWVQRVTP